MKWRHTPWAGEVEGRTGGKEYKYLRAASRFGGHAGGNIEKGGGGTKQEQQDAEDGRDEGGIGF